jgi:crotonobetainyl-CoA:carnitine CoA-transferase CaiB-like acyl-CoA transferase
LSAPLDGVRVCDLSRLLPGPFASMLLADLGARVDKIEDLDAGDYLRAMPPSVEGASSTFWALNRGKRSLAIDLKKPEGRDALLELVLRYDVLLESYRPGVMARLGLDYPKLRERNPALVYCAITGYGQDGPLKGRAGHDLNYLARAGVLSLTGPRGGPPQPPGVQMADVGGALHAVIGIASALVARAKTGEGRFVDVSMCEGAMTFGVFGLMNAFAGMPFLQGTDSLMGGIAPYATYATKDGKAVSLGALEPKFWMTFCTATGIEPSMEALMPGPHQADWKSKVAQVIAARTRDEWAEFAAQHDCCLEPVLEPHELLTDPQHTARGVFVKSAGGMPMPKIGSSPAPVKPPPERGAHTVEILREAGFDQARIEALRAAKAIR